jgi:hypothetical protein
MARELKLVAAKRHRNPIPFHSLSTSPAQRCRHVIQLHSDAWSLAIGIALLGGDDGGP